MLLNQHPSPIPPGPGLVYESSLLSYFFTLALYCPPRAHSYNNHAPTDHISSVDHGSNRGGSPQFLGKNYHTLPIFLKLRSQLSIWIFMPHRSDIYEKVAFRSEESPPFLRFAIRPIPVARQAKTCLKSLFFVRFRPRRNGHWPDWNSENGR